jgi:hypothetical protein
MVSESEIGHKRSDIPRGITVLFLFFDYLNNLYLLEILERKNMLRFILLMFLPCLVYS